MAHKPGYIIMLTLLIIAAAVALITAVVRESFSYQRQVKSMQDRVRARMLALSGLELVRSQISFIPPKKKEEKGQQQEGPVKKEKEETMPQEQQYALKLVPLLNKWHTVELTPGTDAVEGSLSYYITSEDGKINLESLLNDIFPPKEEKKKGKNEKASDDQKKDGSPADAEKTQAEKEQEEAKKQEEQKKRLIGLIDELVKKEKEVSIQAALKDLHGQINRAPEDATELLRVSKFKKLQDIFFVTKEPQKKPFFFMDLFTVQESAKKLNPWLASSSVKTLFGFGDNKEVKFDKAMAKNIKKSMNWSADWDKTLGKMYGKKFEALDKRLQDALSPAFEPTAFSVVSYCKVGSVTQKVAALFEIAPPESGADEKSIIFQVTKLYWL